MNTIFFKCCPKLIDPLVCTIASGLDALLFLPAIDFFFHSSVFHMSIMLVLKFLKCQEGGGGGLNSLVKKLGYL